MSIAADIENRTGRRASRTSVLITLERLEDKELVSLPVRRSHATAGRPGQALLPGRTPRRAGGASRPWRDRHDGRRTWRHAEGEVSAMAPQPLRALMWLLRRVSSRAAADAADRRPARRARPIERRPGVRRGGRGCGSIRQAIKVASSFAASVMPRLWRSGWQTLRDAVRSLRRSPGVRHYWSSFCWPSASPPARSHISVVDAVVLRPLAVEGGDRLVSVSTRDDNTRRASRPTCSASSRQVTGFEPWPRSRSERWHVAVDGVADDIEVMYSTSDLFACCVSSP